MREVEYCGQGYFGGVNFCVPKDIKKGFFHGFFSEGNSTEGLETYALIENEDGTVSCIGSQRIRFTSPPTEKN